MAEWLGIIKNCFDSDKVYYSQHARKEMLEEEFGMISDEELYEAVCNGEIIETYPDDIPVSECIAFWLNIYQSSFTCCMCV